MSADAGVLTDQASSAADEVLAAEMRDLDNDRAYATLVERYSVATIAYCSSRLFRSSDAEDTAQDVWLKVWERRSQFSEQGPTSFRRWLFTIASRTCIDANRKKRPDSTADEVFTNLGDPHLQPGDSIACLAERRSVLESCLELLPERQRCVVRATLAGERTGATAEMCGCTAPQASTAKHQAIKALQDCTARKGV